MVDLAFYVLNMCNSFVIIRKIKFYLIFIITNTQHNCVIICQVAKCISMLMFLHCEQFSFKARISITTCLNILIFAIYVGKASFKCSVSFILSTFIIVWLDLSWKNAICTKFWTGAVVRYYGNWKWCCSYFVCHKPITFGH